MPTARLRRHHSPALFCFALLLLVLLTACSPPRTTLARLVSDQEEMSGVRVVVVGTVVPFASPDGPDDLILEDPGNNRVLLVPPTAAGDYVGRRVKVTGMYEFDPRRGRLLWVEAIVPVGEG